MVNMSIDKNCQTFFPEIWGGIESSINRVGDCYRDQLGYSGHYHRPQDIDLFANLGIRALRYPVLWENHQAREHQDIDWSWTRSQLEKIRSRNLVPIAGLLHHGSGPSYTDLLDDEFAPRFSLYAGAVAKEFPWIEHYTPVNEPLTTARFSGLYGLWHPHRRNETDFIKMLLNQVKATVLAMREIRKVNPLAKLVQTEDLSKTHSTDLLSYQASFENERRWLTWDLLCGRVSPSHYFWDYFISLGITEESLIFFLGNNCPPQVMGFNYYVTSERFLDEKLDNYPVEMHGGNGRHYFADTDAARAGCMEGILPLLKEAWERYRLPIAITECHLCCTREEQLRWLHDTWQSCCALKKEGIDIRALTAWALLGAYDWDSLLIQQNLSYEIGVFDNSCDELRPTLLAKMIKSISSTGNFDHPLLGQRGWWSPGETFPAAIKSGSVQVVLIIGENDSITNIFSEIFRHRSIPSHIVRFAGHDLIDLIKKFNAWAVIDTSFIGGDESPADNEFILPARPAIVAEICKSCKISLLTFSDIYNKPGERKIISVNPETLIIRLNSFNAYTDHQWYRKFDRAMDFFIDEEEGLWEISDHGVVARVLDSQREKTNTEPTKYYVAK